MKLTVSCNIAAPVAKVWQKYTHPADVQQWNFASDDWHCPSASADLRIGGKFSSRMEAKDGSFGFDFEGTYTQLVENSLIEYEFGGRLAQVQFEAAGAATQVSVSFDAEDTHSIAQQQEGWQAILNNFKMHVEKHA